MAARDRNEEEERQRKREEILASMESEDRIIKLAPMLSQFETAKPTPMVEPADPELGIKEFTRAEIPLGDQRLAPPLLEELTLPTGGKLKIPPIRGQREALQAQHEAEARAKAEAGTEILTQEAWDELPDFYKGRWTPGQRVDSKTVGEIGMTVWKSAEARAERETERAAKAAEKAGQPPPSRKGPRGQIQDWINGQWVDVGPAEAPDAPGTGKAAKGEWLTDSSTGQRVWVTDEQKAAAPPGKYSDIKPNQPRVNLSGQMAQSRSAAELALGSAKDPESMWGLAEKWTVPGPGALMGPAAAAIGMSASVNKAFRGPGSDDLRQYETIIQGFTPLFARAVGHSGVLTEKDEARTRMLFPVLSGPGADTRSEAVRKLQRLQKIMNGQEVVPAGIFEARPGHWDTNREGKPAGAEAGSSMFTPEETSLMSDYGYPTGGQ